MLGDKIYGIGRSIRALSRGAHDKVHNFSRKAESKPAAVDPPKVSFKIHSNGDITMDFPTSNNRMFVRVRLDLENARIFNKDLSLAILDANATKEFYDGEAELTSRK